MTHPHKQWVSLEIRSRARRLEGSESERDEAGTFGAVRISEWNWASPSQLHRNEMNQSLVPNRFGSPSIKIIIGIGRAPLECPATAAAANSVSFWFGSPLRNRSGHRLLFEKNRLVRPSQLRIRQDDCVLRFEMAPKASGKSPKASKPVKAKLARDS